LPKSLLLVNEDSAQPAGAAPRPPEPVAVPSESLREELFVMVREHPQAAASVLRTWIGNSSQ